MNQTNTVEPTSKLRRIPRAAIKIDPPIQQRVAGTSQEVVDDYARAMRDGDAFPPIIVFSDDGVNYCLVDGYHRFDAYRLAHPDVQEIECEVYTGDHDDALIWACGANARHGLRRTRLDKLKAVITLLRINRCSDWSDRRVAEHCGVSHPFVAKVRREHVEKLPDTGRKDEDQARSGLAAPDVSVSESPAIPQDRRRTVMRGGKSYPMKTMRISIARATLSRPKNAEAKSLLTSLEAGPREIRQRSWRTRDCRSLQINRASFLHARMVVEVGRANGARRICEGALRGDPATRQRA
jgi:hypothetical protein